MTNWESLEKLAQDVEALDQVLSSGMDPNACDATGGSLLAHAAAQGRVDAVERLLAAGAVPDAFGVEPSPLVLAAEGGHAEVVRLLLEAGAELGGEEWWEDGELALWSAVAQGHVAVAGLLVEAGAFDRLVREWIEALIEAAMGLRGKRKSQLVELLGLALARRAEGGNMPAVAPRLLSRLVRGLSKHPQHAEILRRHSDELKALEEEVINLYAEEREFEKALDLVRRAPPAVRSRLATAVLPWAVQQPRIDEAEWLLEIGADPFEIEHAGKSAFMEAVRKGFLPMVERLISRGADCRATGEDGKTVLEWAHSGPARPLILAELYRTAADYDRRVDHQLAAYADERERIVRASAEALMAAREERWERALELLAQGDPNWVSERNHERVLTEAAKQGRTDLVEQLFALGASAGESWVLSKVIGSSYFHSVEMGEWMMRKLIDLGYGDEVSSQLLGHVSTHWGDAVGDWTLRTVIEQGHGDEVFTPELLERVWRLRREMRGSPAEYDQAVDQALAGCATESERKSRASEEALIAAREERWERALELIALGDLNWRSARNERVLTEAARQGLRELVEELLERGAEPGKRLVFSALVDPAYIHSWDMGEWLERRLAELGYSDGFDE